jgi:hypothetical protein
LYELKIDTNGNAVADIAAPVEVILQGVFLFASNAGSLAVETTLVRGRSDESRQRPADMCPHGSR